MARKRGKAEERQGNALIPKGRSRNLAVTVLLLAVGLVLVIILALFLLQSRGQDGGEDGSASSALLPPPLLIPDQQSLGIGQIIYLYFRLDDGEILLAQPRQVNVQVSETPEEAAVRALIEGPQTSSAKLTRLLPADTRIVRAEGSGDTYYITFDKALLRSQSVGETLPMESALRDRLRLIAKSVTNTVVNIGNYGKVQILIDYDGSGYGRPPTSYEFGFSNSEEGDLPALVYDEAVVCNAKNSLAKLMTYIQNEDWQKIYTEFLTNDGKAISTVQDFAEQMDALEYRLSDWDLVNQQLDVPQGQAQFLLNLSYIYEDGRLRTRENIPLRFYESGGVWKVNESAFDRLLLMTE